MTPDLERELRGVERIRTDAEFAGRVYASLCNTQWRHEAGTLYSCTWRYAGQIVAAIRGDTSRMAYMAFYCSGNEGVIDPEVAAILAESGWRGSAL